MISSLNLLAILLLEFLSTFEIKHLKIKGFHKHLKDSKIQISIFLFSKCKQNNLDSVICHDTLWAIIFLTFLEIQPHIRSHGQALKNEKLKIRKKILCGKQPSEEKM